MNKQTAKWIACDFAAGILNAEIPNGSLFGLGYRGEDLQKIEAAFEELIGELARRGENAPRDPASGIFNDSERESAGG